MKKQLLLLVLMFTGTITAQNILIPDTNFKNRLLLATATNNIAKDANGASMVVDVNDDNEIQESEALAVYQLRLNNSSISNLQGIEEFSNLTHLYAKNNLLTTLDVSSMVNLQYLDVEDNSITQLNVTGCNSLASLVCWVNEITSLNLTGLPALTDLRCSNNQITNLDLSDVNLTMLVCGENLFTTLDISNQTNLTYFNVFGAENLVHLYMKNGNIDPVDGETFGYCENLQMICADEGEIEPILAVFEQMLQWGTNIDAFVTSYCTYTPGGDYNTITGTVIFDGNNNGCEAGESLNSYVKMNISGNNMNGATYTNLPGTYSFYLPSPGNFTITPDFENDWFAFTPASAEVTISEIDNSSITQNFCVTANGIHPDVEVVIVPFTTAQPGFDAMYKVIYKNKGNQALSGTVTLNFDDALIDYVTATPDASASTGYVYWFYEDLMPFESRSITVTFNVNSPQETPAVIIGDVLAFSASVTPETGDETPADNSFTFNHVVTGSFDPNDITCLEGDAVSVDKIGEYLHYNINFENTGDAAATFIVVKNIVDETQFDISTLQVLNASHVMQTKIEGNEVEFYFDAINLGPQEKGNIVFKIKTLNTLQVNDDVTQQANIFFDYNWPIETNEANTVFAALSTGNFEMDASVKIYPNPSNGIVNIAADSTIDSFELYDVQGRLLQIATVNEVEAKLDISQRAAGMYFVKIKTENGIMVEKIVKR